MRCWWRLMLRLAASTSRTFGELAGTRAIKCFQTLDILDVSDDAVVLIPTTCRCMVPTSRHRFKCSLLRL